MRVLITGINGFVGGHLAELLLHRGGWDIWGLSRSGKVALPHLHGQVQMQAADLCHAEQIRHVLARVRPQIIFHLAGQAFVPESFRDPATTLQTNVHGLLNIFLALLAEQLSCRVLVVGSYEVYGMIQPHQSPIAEDTPLRPTSPYGVSKVAQDMLALQYHLSHQLDVIRVRPFNHIGPRQNQRFVAPAFARQIARVEAGLQDPVIRVGNLTPQRDFTDVRDMVRAYVTAVEAGEAGQVYNLGSGRPVAIQTLLDTLLAASDTEVEVVPDPERMRPVNVPVVVSDIQRFHTLTGWEPRISFEQTLYDILDDWRARIHEEPADAE